MKQSLMFFVKKRKQFLELVPGLETGQYSDLYFSLFLFLRLRADCPSRSACVCNHDRVYGIIFASTIYVLYCTVHVWWNLEFCFIFYRVLQCNNYRLKHTHSYKSIVVKYSDKIKCECCITQAKIVLLNSSTNPNSITDGKRNNVLLVFFFL